MNNLYEIIESHHLHPIAYRRKKSVYIIDTKNDSYVIKLNTSNYDIYKYLISRGFNHFPKNYNYKNDNYDLSLFLENNMESSEQKLSDLLEIMALLHRKTSYKRILDLDEIKEIYEKLNAEIQNSKKYYLNINDEIEKKTFFSPSEYLLLRNISLIYFSLDKALKLLQEWYEMIIKEKNIRVCLLHNNVDLEHLIINENKYLISWDKASFDIPINDLVSFFIYYYKNINFPYVYQLYNKINPLDEIEKKYLLINLSIPKILTLSNDTYHDTMKINDEITFLNKVYELIEEKNNK